MERASFGWRRRSLVLLCVAAVIVLAFCWPVVMRLLSTAGIAVVSAALLTPLSKRLEDRMNRTLAAVLSMLSLILGLLLFLGLLIPPLTRQVQQIIAQIPTLLDQGKVVLERINGWLVSTGLSALPGDSFLGLQDASHTLNNVLLGVVHYAGGMAESLGQLALWPVLTFYFLKDRERFCHRLAMWVPIQHRRVAVRTALESRRALMNYLRGQAVVAVVVGVMTAIGLWIVGIPAWLALGLLMGILDMIPYFGPLLGTIPVLLFSATMGLPKVLWSLVVVVLVQQFETTVVSPRVIGDSTGLHPVTVVFSITAGSMLWGIWGMLLALPVVVAGRAALRVLSAGET